MEAREAAVFVDWNSQLRRCPEEFESDAGRRASFALRNIGKLVSKILCGLDNTGFFRVRMRLYHGWTIGFTQTLNRRAVAGCAEYDEPDQLFPSRRVIALTDIEFGDKLLDALPARENQGLGIHLPNTMRRQHRSEPAVEKMVDTALASDLLSWARSAPESIALVISSDDDMIPPTFIAEAWMAPAGGTVLAVRPGREGEDKFLRLEGLTT